jgi:3-deoxy-D-manno-octulosonate 8-phosphate phosphatase (KDO 8-P phosphatase)
MKKSIKNFVLDVDGVLTTGQFFYSAKGKTYKVFGPDDSDALNLIRDKVVIHMVTGDKRGFDISHKRVVEDMKFPLDLVSTFDRVAWIKNKYDPKQTIYMGDGIFDALVFKQVGYSIAPANSFQQAKDEADFVTKKRGGEGAVAEACFHIMTKFFKPINLHKMSFTKGVGVWK